MDERIFCKNNTIFIVYVDDATLIVTDENKINKVIENLKYTYALTDEGDLNEYLKIKMENLNDGQRKLTQTTLIKRILDHVKIHHHRPKDRRPRRSPANKILQKDLGGPKRKESWDYQSVIGMLN